MSRVKPKVQVDIAGDTSPERSATPEASPDVEDRDSNDEAEENEEQEEEQSNGKSSNGKGGAKKSGNGRNAAKNKKLDKKKQAASKKKSVKVVRKAAPTNDNNDGGDDDEAITGTAAAVAGTANGDADETKGAGSDYRHCTGVLISRPTSKDVKIGNFSLSSYGRQLVLDTTIEMTIGRRYGLIGPNGSGKSTFLRCLANREVPIPKHIDIFFLEEEAPPSELTALQAVIADVERKISVLEEEAEKACEELGPESEIVTDLYARLDELDPSTFKARAGQLLKGLGFSQELMEKKTKDMSGGWRMRVALAQALFVKPTLLLLDEPTNHLDLEACVWLENYLAKYDRCLVVVSHSQDFLNGVCTNIIHITMNRKLEVYGGNYDQFVQTKQENEVNQMKRYKKEQDDIKHIKAFIASCGTYSNLVRQAKSKQKILDKMEAAGLTEKVMSEPKFNFRFPSVEQLPPPILAFIDVGFSYSGEVKDLLYQHVDVGVRMDSRVALVGPNGAGKSTLLKLMVGELHPVQGTVRKHLHLNIARYHQHSADVLDHSKSPLDFVMEKHAEKRLGVEDWRQHLGKYGVRSYMQTTPIGKLSDGQKSRLVFAMMALERPHLLLLDEPTNHLDIECIDSLAEALNAFEGAVVLVSHDFRLIKQVAKDIWVCDKKKIALWPGDIASYKQSLVKAMGLV